jgi:hypothetical protein
LDIGSGHLAGVRLVGWRRPKVKVERWLGEGVQLRGGGRRIARLFNVNILAVRSTPSPSILEVDVWKSHM